MLQRLRKYILLFLDTRIDDELLRHLVATLFVSPAALYASMTMSVAVTLEAWVIAGDNAFLDYVYFTIVLAIARSLVIYIYGQAKNHDADTRQKTIFYDDAFLVISVLLSVTIGMMNYALIKSGNVNAASSAMAVTVGYSIAFVMRSASRPRLLAYQVIFLCAPMIFYFATTATDHGWVVAILLVMMIGFSIIMGGGANEKIVELYRANQKTTRMARYDMLTIPPAPAVGRVR